MAQSASQQADRQPDLADISPEGSSQQHKTHLLLMLNGLVGSPANWNIVSENLEQIADLSHVALLASTSNSKGQVLIERHHVSALQRRNR